MKIVHANFEAFGSKFLAQLRRNCVLSSGNEVKARSKAEFRFKLSQTTAAPQTYRTLDVMSQHQGKFFTIRPALPPGRSLLGARHDWPDVLDSRLQPQSNSAANGRTQGPGNKGLKLVVDSIP